MIQPASFFSSIAPVKAYSSDATMPLAGARPKFGPTASAQPLLERISREPQAKPGNLDPRHESDLESPQKLQDFIDTILTNGEFLPVTRDAQEDPAFSQNGSSQSNSQPDPQAVTATSSSSTENMARVRAAAAAWQQIAPERVNAESLPSAVASYLNVQTGDTPALGLSLFA